ncbi:MAG: MFS transporter [Alphaproteobacteria bacterium]
MPLRHQCAVYGIGLFATSMYHMSVTIVPLFVRDMALTPLMLGFVLGCRPILPLFLSIHAGSLMDRIGGRRVMVFFALIGLITPILYPVMPFVWAVIVLQLLSGLADSMGWLGAQTLVGQLMKGRTRYAGRLSFIIRIGHLVGPPMVGATWDLVGPWGAFSLISLWGFGVLASALMIPALPANSPESPTPPRERLGLRDLLPNPADYVSAFRLLAIPAVAITVLIGMMTHVGNNIQSTFYVVWLDQIGISGTLIGVLVSISAVGAALGSLVAAKLARYIRPYWLLWSTVFIALMLIAITPLLGTYVLLAIVLSLRSTATGIHQPVVISLMLRTAGSVSHGKAIGLRGTMNRITSICAPMLMGAIAEVVGLEIAFYMIGGISAFFMLWLGWRMKQLPEIHERGHDSA